MAPISWFQRIYFAAVGLFALWVGVWGYFVPARVDGAIPWLVPPLHARFLGAMYLSGTTFMLGCILARRYAEVRVVLPMIAIWTGMLFVVSLFHLGEFDYTRQQTWAWFGTYLLFPLIALGIAWQHRTDRESPPARPLPAWMRAYLLAQGVATTLLGLALLLAPGFLAARWPWPVSLLLAQIYAAPFLSYGVGSLLLARCRTWPQIRVAVVATLVFTAAALLASLLHRALFGAGPATWLWFGGLSVATAALGLIAALGLRASHSSYPPDNLSLAGRAEKG